MSGPLGGALEFMRLLWAVDHGLHATSKRMGRNLGVTGPQRLVVRIVGRFPGITSGELAEVLHVHPSTLTGVVERLVRRRLITRRPDPADGRRGLLHLGKRGVVLNRTKRGTIEEAVSDVLARAEPRDVEATTRLLGMLAGRLNPARPASGRVAATP